MQNEIILKIIEIMVSVCLVLMGSLDIKFGKVKNKILFVFLMFCLARCIFYEITVRVILEKIMLILILISIYFLGKGKIGGGDIKVLLGLCLIMSIDKFILLVLYASMMALIVATIVKIINKRHIESIRFIPFITASYLLLQIQK